MESQLHRALKERFGPTTGGRIEVPVGAYRVDAVSSDGSLIEIQCGPLASLRRKLECLLPSCAIRVIKPIVVARRIVKRAHGHGTEPSSRFSPKRGAITDVFDDLIGLARIFPHPNLTIEVLAVEIDEIRVVRKRRPGFSVLDRELREVVGSATLRSPEDLWALLPDTCGEPFTTRSLAGRIERSLAFAQRVAYCLRQSGAVETLGRSGRHRLYLRRFDPPVLAASPSSSRPG